MTKFLIIHADDGGLTRSVNQAIIDMLNSGAATSTSLMAPTPYFEELADSLQLMPDVDVGVHVTLNCMYEKSPWKPVTNPQKIPSLVNSEGSFRSSPEEFAKHATAADVETEIRAQIDRFLELGLSPSHIDTHQGTVFVKMDFLQVYIKLALEYHLHPMLLSPNEHTRELMQARGLELNLDQIKNLNLPFLDFLYMADIHSDNNFEQRSQRYQKVISGINPGLSQIIIHPGYDDEDLQKITEFGYNRQFDLDIFMDEGTQQLINNEQIQLIRWKDLQQSGLIN